MVNEPKRKPKISAFLRKKLNIVIGLIREGAHCANPLRAVLYQCGAKFAA